MERTKRSFIVDSGIWWEFKYICLEKKITISSYIEQILLKEIENERRKRKEEIKDIP